MTKIQSITIPQPCSQSWQQMEVREQGRHCQHCAKIVIDFTKMTNDEILNYLAGEENVCGRFGQTQFAGISYQVGSESKVVSERWKKWLLAASLLGFCFSGRLSAQSTPGKPATTQSPPASNAAALLGKVLISRVSVDRTIVGEVIGADDKLPVAGAQIKIKGTNTDVSADNQGCFSLPVPAAGSPVILIVSYIGYKTQEITVPAADRGKSITIAMQPAQFTMGEIVIPKSKSPSERVLMFYQYMPWPINRLFK